MIFINLPVSDLTQATSLYTSIGGKLNPMFSDKNASCMAFSDSIFVMLLTKDFFNTFIPSGIEILDTKSHIQVLNCMSVMEKEEVDKMCLTAEKEGGRVDPTTIKQMPGMYGRSFADADGHIWELMWMDRAAAQEGCPEKAAKEKAEAEAKAKAEAEAK